MTEVNEVRHDDLLKLAFGENLTLWQMLRIGMALLITLPGLAHIFNTVFATVTTDFVCLDLLKEKGNNEINTDFDLLKKQNLSNVCRENCTNYEFDQSYWHNTVPMHFNLVCETKGLITVSKMSFFSGLAAGTFIAGFISDKFGRIPSALICSTMVLTSGIFCTFTGPNFALFCLSWFVVGASGIGVYTVMFIWSTEIVTHGRAKTMVGILFALAWSSARFLSVALAYFIRNWQNVLRITSALYIFAIAFLLSFIPESPRWLLATNDDQQRQRAKQILIKAATKDRILQVESVDMETVAKADLKGQKTEPSHLLITSSLLRNRTLIMFYNWLAVSFIIYGVSLNWKLLTGSLFVNFLISSILDVPTKTLTALGLLKFHRRKLVYNVLMSFAGLSFIATGIIPRSSSNFAVSACFLFGYFNISACFSILWLYTAELFPTGLRNTAVGSCSFSARIGGILATLVTAIGELDVLLPTIAFAVVSLLSVLLSLLLPETKGLSLPESLKEMQLKEENKSANGAAVQESQM